MLKSHCNSAILSVPLSLLLERILRGWMKCWRMSPGSLLWQIKCSLEACRSTAWRKLDWVAGAVMGNWNLPKKTKAAILTRQERVRTPRELDKDMRFIISWTVQQKRQPVISSLWLASGTQRSTPMCAASLPAHPLCANGGRSIPSSISVLWMPQNGGSYLIGHH